MVKAGENKKSFSYAWDTIELPVVLLIAYSLLDLFFSVTTYIGKIIPVWIFGALLTIFAFGIIGWKVAKNNELEFATRYGAYAGLVVGLASAVIGLITYYFYPEKIADALQAAAQSGADMSVVQTFMKIGIYASFIISPAINAGIGALISWVSSLIFKKK